MNKIFRTLFLSISTMPPLKVKILIWSLGVMIFAAGASFVLKFSH